MQRKRVHKMIIGFAVVAVLLLLILILFPPSKGEIPQFYDENGEVIKNSISEKCYLEAGDSKLGMIIMGRDIRNPVLLVCGGGPGIPEYLLEDRYPSGLADKFVVCYLVDYLSERFGQEKIYLMGHSFGTYIAIKTVQQYPDYYNVYIAMA